MAKNPLDYLILGPAHPFRGGIADTQHELALALQRDGNQVELITFTKLYPKVIFPGKSQLIDEVAPENLKITQLLHAYNPIQWSRVVKYICSKSPKTIVFRYYTPLLAFSYAWIAKNLPKSIKKVAIIDNWIPHEDSKFDIALNILFSKYIESISSLSPYVAKQIKTDFKGPVWAGFHPINTNLHPIINQQKARTELKWNAGASYVLFFGLIRKYKGLELLISAFNETPLVEQNIMLYVAGECYENQKKYIQIVKSFNLEERVILDFKFKNTAEIQQLFSASDIVAQTYHKATQSGVTPLAYHYQKPLLVSDIEGLRTPIISDQTGLVVKKESKSIAKGICEILDKKKLNNYSKNIKKASIKYSWSSFSKQWVNFLSEI